MKPNSVRDCLNKWLSSPRGVSFSELGETLIELAETLFFASLATEEKSPTRVSLVWVPNGVSQLKDVTDSEEVLQEIAWDVVALERRIFEVVTLVKAAPLVEFGRSVLVVGGEPGAFFIDGVARRNSRTDGGACFVLSAPAPGVVSVSLCAEEIFRYERGAAESLPPAILWMDGPVRQAIIHVGASLQLKTNVINREPFPEVTRGLISGMSRTQHGGLLLLLPREPSEAERELVKLKLLDPMVLTRVIQRVHVARVARTSAHLRRKPSQFGTFASETETEAEARSAEVALTEIILDIARLTAVDNALLIGPSFQVVGAQFEVTSQKAPEVHVGADIAGTVGPIYDLDRHGSRHRAAACFANDNPGALAFAVSADGPIRCFLGIEGNVLTWSVRLPEV